AKSTAREERYRHCLSASRTRRPFPHANVIVHDLLEFCQILFSVFVSSLSQTQMLLPPWLGSLLFPDEDGVNTRKNTRKTVVEPQRMAFFPRNAPFFWAAKFR